MSRMLEEQPNDNVSEPMEGEAESRVVKCKRANSFNLSLDGLSLSQIPNEVSTLYLNFIDLSRNKLTSVGNFKFSIKLYAESFDRCTTNN